MICTGFSYEHTWIPFTYEGYFVPSLIEIDTLVLKGKIFKIRQCIFSLFFPLKKAGPIYWINLNPCHPKMLCAKLGGNWPTGSGGDFFFFFIKVFSLFRSNLLLGRGGALHLNKLEYQGYFMPSSAEIGPVVLEKKKMWKVYNDDTTDNGQIVLRKAHLNLWLRWAKTSLSSIVLEKKIFTLRHIFSLSFLEKGVDLHLN